ncbi:MAG: RNA polymerase sigma factor [Peptococcales bacterium]
MDDTSELIVKAKKGDKNALVKLVMEKKDEYYKLAYIYLNNQEDALDALGDMILILHQNIKRLKKPESFYSWSKTILVNCCRKLIRKQKKVIFLDRLPEIPYNEKFSLKDEQVDLGKHLTLLNLHQQEAIKLKYFLDMDYEQIAELTQVPVGTVKSRVFNGLKKLKESLGGDYFD